MIWRKINKMTKEKAKEPQLRFKEFTNAWEQRKLGEVAEFNPKAELPDIFMYVDLESVVGTEMITHREEKKISAPSRAQRLAQQGDLFYQTVRPYQKNNYLFEKPDKNYVFSTGYAQMRPHQDGYFLLCLVQNERFVKVVLDNCTGTSYPAINSNDLAKIDAYFPKDKKEQEEIGIFFRTLDRLITLHLRKCDLLSKAKKTLLQKMFPKNGKTTPEIRFKGFTGAWEQRKLGEVCPIFLDGDWIESKDQSDSGVRLIQTGNIGVGTYLDKLDKLKWVSEDTFDRLHCEEVFPGDILISRLPDPAGRACIIPETGQKMITAVDVTIARTSEECDSPFLLQYLCSEQYFRDVNNALAGSTRQRISRGNLEALNISIPSNLEEQKKIGKFFRSLDRLITLHQHELEKLKNIKKSCLKMMFV